MSTCSPKRTRHHAGHSAPFRRAGLSRIMPLLCLLLSLLAPASALAAPTAEGQKEGPAPKNFQVGSLTVTALLDRPTEMDISLFSGPASPEQRQKLMPGDKAPASVNAFLIRTPGGKSSDGKDAEEKNILVDAGFGTLLPQASQLERCLADVGLVPADIDIVLLTHMHSDHIAGLLNKEQRAFPKAVVMVSRPELDYWTGLAADDTANDNAALVKKVRTAYGPDLLPPFAFGEALLPGVTALDAAGHTPGHSVFLLESEGKSLLIVGDLLHAAALQFPLPDENAAYDMDPAAAAKTRRAILSLAAEKKIPVAGMHIPFPGMGTVKAEGAGFTFTPLP